MSGGSYKNIEYEQIDSGVTITLDRPPLNVLNIEMMEELSRALSVVQKEQPKFLLLRAKGKAFSAGVDVGDHTQEKAKHMITAFHKMFHILNHMSTPAIAAVQGACLGGGCELATFCDIVIASEDAKFGQPEVKVRVMAPVAATHVERTHETEGTFGPYMN